MKPLIRWTIGKVSESGWECLSESVRLMLKVYPDFDYIICHNNLQDNEVNRLQSFGIPLHKQSENQFEFPYTMKSDFEVANHVWKLCPMRLRPEGHEMWVDNDIIFKNRIPEIDEWVKSETGIISTTYGRERYGRFDSVVPEGISDCAGLFGLPPSFDMKSEVVRLCNGQPLEGFDEQGMITHIINSMNHHIKIEPWHLFQTNSASDICALPDGYHFIRINRNPTIYWENYKFIHCPEPKLYGRAMIRKIPVTYL